MTCVTGLLGQLGRWTSFIRDVGHGIFFDPTKMHVLDHKGQYLSVRGPLNVARPVQGWPVIVQAGASESGRQLAAETAEAVFTAQSDLRRRPAVLCRREGPHGKACAAPASTLKILPACFVVVGDTVEEARRPSARNSTALSITPTLSARCPSPSATTRQNLIPTDRCRTISRKQRFEEWPSAGRLILPGVRI